MVKIEVGDAGSNARPSTPNLLQNRRVQRIFGFALVFVLLSCFLVYQRTTLGSLNVVDVLPGGIVPPTTTTNDVFDKSPESLATYVNDHKDSASQTSTISTLPELDPSRVALIIETRAIPHLPALILHFISTLPPQWIVKHVGEDAAFDLILKHKPLQAHIESGKLVLTKLPEIYPTRNNEDLSATLTSLTFYRDFLAPAEWVLMFQTDSMICSGSPLTIDDWLDMGYDWYGAPWHLERAGGNGGFSLRHVSSIVKLLESETRAAYDPAWEDLWLSERLPNCAPAPLEMKFSVESYYYETPLGYHLRGSGKLSDPVVWGNRTRRRQIMEYCPEIKIILGVVSLEDPHEEQWRLEDAGLAKPDPQKNFEEIIQNLSDSFEVDLVKDETKAQWSISAKTPEARAAVIAGQKAIEEERARVEASSIAAARPTVVSR